MMMKDSSYYYMSFLIVLLLLSSFTPQPSSPIVMMGVVAWMTTPQYSHHHFLFHDRSTKTTKSRIPPLWWTTTTRTVTATTKRTRTTRTRTTLEMATWSDARAVKEYQDFLNSGRQTIELAHDVPSVIVTRPGGPTESLAQWLQQSGTGSNHPNKKNGHHNDVVDVVVDNVLISPDQELPSTIGGLTEYPIYIVLPAYELNDFLLNLPDSYKGIAQDNFCFFSGGLLFGNIEHVLKERGYCRDDMTQIIITGLHIAPNGRGQDLSVNLGLDANGESKMAGECAACGKWAGAIAEKLQRNSISCTTDFYREWRRKMWERHILDVCFHLVGAVRNYPYPKQQEQEQEQQEQHNNNNINNNNNATTTFTTTMADVAMYYSDEVSDMIWEISQLLRGWRAITLLYGFEERMFAIVEKATSEQQDHYCVLTPQEMYPYLWGNTVVLQSNLVVEYLYFAQQQQQEQQQQSITTKETTETYYYDNNGWLSTIQLPPHKKKTNDKSKIMRSGNLRADGVV